MSIERGPTAASKKIPKSVQLGLCVAREWGGYTTRSLKAAIGALADRRFLEKGYGNSGITKLEGGRVVLKYGYLEGLARTTGIPVGVLLLSTRAMSEVRNGHFDKAERFADGLEKLAVLIKARAEKRKKLARRQQADMLKELFDAWKAHGLYDPETRPDGNTTSASARTGDRQPG